MASLVNTVTALLLCAGIRELLSALLACLPPSSEPRPAALPPTPPLQWGLKHYWDALLDADLECDSLGWQYVAGCMAGVWCGRRHWLRRLAATHVPACLPAPLPPTHALRSPFREKHTPSSLCCLFSPQLSLLCRCLPLSLITPASSLLPPRPRSSPSPPDARITADAHEFSHIIDYSAESKRFDPDGNYVRRWLPVLARLPAKYIHEPWLAPQEVLEDAGGRPVWWACVMCLCCAVCVCVGGQCGVVGVCVSVRVLCVCRVVHASRQGVLCVMRLTV